MYLDDQEALLAQKGIRSLESWAQHDPTIIFYLNAYRAAYGTQAQQLVDRATLDLRMAGLTPEVPVDPPPEEPPP